MKSGPQNPRDPLIPIKPNPKTRPEGSSLTMRAFSARPGNDEVAPGGLGLDVQEGSQNAMARDSVE